MRLYSIPEEREEETAQVYEYLLYLFNPSPADPGYVLLLQTV